MNAHHYQVACLDLVVGSMQLEASTVTGRYNCCC